MDTPKSTKDGNIELLNVDTPKLTKDGNIELLNVDTLRSTGEVIADPLKSAHHFVIRALC